MEITKEKLLKDQAETNKQFNQLEEQRQRLLAQAQQILTEEILLQGENRRIEKLLAELKEKKNDNKPS